MGAMRSFWASKVECCFCQVVSIRHSVNLDPGIPGDRRAMLVDWKTSTAHVGLLPLQSLMAALIYPRKVCPKSILVTMPSTTRPPSASWVAQFGTLRILGMPTVRPMW